MSPDFRLANYFSFYVAALLFFAVGAITTLGLDWYGTLALPAWMPSSFWVAVIWFILFLLMAISAVSVWNVTPRDKAFLPSIVLYMGNALLVLLWNYLFFGIHELFSSFLSSVLVLVSVIALIITSRRVSQKASVLLFPYLVWMLFATYVMYAVFSLNA